MTCDASSSYLLIASTSLPTASAAALRLDAHGEALRPVLPGGTRARPGRRALGAARRPGADARARSATPTSPSACPGSARTSSPPGCATSRRAASSRRRSCRRRPPSRVYELTDVRPRAASRCCASSPSGAPARSARRPTTTSSFRGLARERGRHDARAGRDRRHDRVPRRRRGRVARRRRSARPGRSTIPTSSSRRRRRACTTCSIEHRIGTASRSRATASCSSGSSRPPRRLKRPSPPSSCPRRGTPRTPRRTRGSR